MPLVIPTQAVPNQSLGVVLGTQPCTINVYQKGQLDYGGLYLDLYVNNVLLRGGVLGPIGVRMIRYAYLGFVGDLMWIDTMTPVSVAPYYTGIGPTAMPNMGPMPARYFLTYLTGADVAGGLGA